MLYSVHLQGALPQRAVDLAAEAASKQLLLYLTYSS